jgi:hypothetical protein
LQCFVVTICEWRSVMEHGKVKSHQIWHMLACDRDRQATA